MKIYSQNINLSSQNAQNIYFHATDSVKLKTLESDSLELSCKENKKDTILAGLYAASATLSAGMAVYSAFSNLGVAAAGAASA